MERDDPAADVASAMVEGRARGSARTRLVLYFAGQATNLTGDAIFLVSLPWLYLREDRVGDLSLVLTAYTVGRLVLVTAGGAITDRWGPRRTMVISDFARFALLLLMMGYHTEITAEVGRGVVVLGLLGALAGVFQPAVATMLPTLVDRDRLQSANSVNSILMSGAGLVGPAVGGFLVAHDVVLVFAVNAASFLVSSVSVLVLAALTPPAQQTQSTSFLRSLGSSPRLWWRAVLDSPTLRVTCVVIAIANLTWSGLINIGLPQAMIDLGGGSVSYGWTLTAAGCGTMLGGVLASRLDRFADKGRAAMLLGIVQAACVLFAAPVDSVVAVGVLFTVLGVANPMTSVTMISMVQEEADERELGRTMALTQLCAFGPQAVSAIIGAAVVAGWGGAGMFVVTGLTLGLSFVYGLVYLPRRRATAPAPAATVDASGPAAAMDATGLRKSRSIEDAS